MVSLEHRTYVCVYNVSLQASRYSLILFIDILKYLVRDKASTITINYILQFGEQNKQIVRYVRST